MKIRIPSPAMIVATLALMVALSGTAVASSLITGAQIKNNTVSTLDITNGTVQSVDVKNNALTTDDVKNGTLKAADFAPGVLTSGAPGAPGQPGAPGAPGTPGLANVGRDGARRQQLDLRKAARRNVPGRQAAHRRRRAQLQRRWRCRTRRELSGRHQVARNGVRDHTHRRELAPRGVRDLRHRRGLDLRNPGRTWARHLPRPHSFCRRDG